jgi:hypothetical protein
MASATAVSIGGLKKADVQINRKMLAQLAVVDSGQFHRRGWRRQQLISFGRPMDHLLPQAYLIGRDRSAWWRRRAGRQADFSCAPR